MVAVLRTRLELELAACSLTEDTPDGALVARRFLDAFVGLYAEGRDEEEARVLAAQVATSPLPWPPSTPIDHSVLAWRLVTAHESWCETAYTALHFGLTDPGGAVLWSTQSFEDSLAWLPPADATALGWCDLFGWGDCGALVVVPEALDDEIGGLALAPWPHLPGGPAGFARLGPLTVPLADPSRALAAANALALVAADLGSELADPIAALAAAADALGSRW